MKLSYLNNKSWEQISREERYYCAELYFHFRNNIKLLIELIAKKTDILTEKERSYNWELAYEVCFYRDYITANKNLLNSKNIFERYSRKRTFDLCLFSEQKIIVIEAKVQQQFDFHQNNTFKNDILDVARLIKEAGFRAPQIDLVGLASTIYFTNVEKYGKGIPGIFMKKYITWLDIYDITGMNVFRQANGYYKK